MSLFPPFLVAGADSYRVTGFVVDPAATFKAQNLVFFDTASHTLKVCGADPALIAGLSLIDASSAIGANNIYPGNKGPVAVLSSDMEVGLSSPTVPVEADVGNVFGIAADGATGIWQLDHTEVVNTRCVVTRVDIANGIFYVKFLAANLQFDAVAS